jgi:heme exporter protein C
MFGRGIKTLSMLSVVLVSGAFALVFFYAPNDADQGFVQKIFYLHVPMAIVALCGFIAGGIFAIRHLRSGDASWDLRSYVAIHLSIILAVGVLVTGSIWSRASWGHWWLWDEPVLVSFLVVFLLYCVYYPLRFAIEDPERQARYSSVFAIAAGAFVPINFAAVRLAEAYTHPRVLDQTGGSMPADMRVTFLIALLGMALLFVTLWKLELTAKHAAMQLKRLRRQRAEREAVVA